MTILSGIDLAEDQYVEKLPDILHMYEEVYTSPAVSYSNLEEWSFHVYRLIATTK
jgi:hypothetical protein